MKILVTAATPDELLAARQALAACPGIDAHCAVTGIGATATAYHTLKQLQQEPFDLAINIGIAGAFNEQLAVGDVCRVVKEYFGDTGVRTPSGFSTLFDENLLNPDTFPFQSGALYAPELEIDTVKTRDVTSLQHLSPSLRGGCKPTKQTPLSTLNSPLSTVTGVTVQTVSGAAKQIEELRARFSPDIETMESAAFFYVCLQEKVPFIALRAISNRVEPRDKSRWNIPLALNNLDMALRSLWSEHILLSRQAFQDVFEFQSQQER